MASFYIEEDIKQFFEEILPKYRNRIPKMITANILLNEVKKVKEIQDIIKKEKNEENTRKLKKAIEKSLNFSAVLRTKDNKTAESNKISDDGIKEDNKMSEGDINICFEGGLQTYPLGKKAKEEFWKYLNDQGKIKEWKNLSNTEENMLKVKSDINKIVPNWKETVYIPARHERRIKILEEAKIPMHCSNIVFPSFDLKLQKKDGTVLAALTAIINYCKAFKNTNPKNIAEQAFYEAAVAPMYEYCEKKYKEYKKSKINIVNRKKLKKEIINQLCYQGKYNVNVIFVQKITRLLMLSREVNKACKISDEEKRNKMLKGLYGEIKTLFPEVTISEEDFTKNKYVEFRRAAKVLVAKINNSGFNSKVKEINDKLIESGKQKDKSKGTNICFSK